MSLFTRFEVRFSFDRSFGGGVGANVPVKTLLLGGTPLDATLPSSSFLRFGLLPKTTGADSEIPSEEVRNEVEEADRDDAAGDADRVDTAGAVACSLGRAGNPWPKMQLGRWHWSRLGHGIDLNRPCGVNMAEREYRCPH